MQADGLRTTSICFILPSRAKRNEMGGMGRNTNYGFTLSVIDKDKGRCASTGLEIGNSPTCAIGMCVVGGNLLTIYSPMIDSTKGRHSGSTSISTQKKALYTGRLQG